MEITYEIFQAFKIGQLKAKVIDQDNIFKNEIFPVIAIGIGFVDCDVLEHDGTQTFDLSEIEFILTN